MEGENSKYEAKLNLVDVEKNILSYDKDYFFKSILPLVNDNEYIAAILLAKKIYNIDDDDFIVCFTSRILKYIKWEEIEKVIALSDEIAYSFIKVYLDKISKREVVVDISVKEIINKLLNKLHETNTFLRFVETFKPANLNKDLRGPVLNSYANYIMKYSEKEKNYIKNYFEDIFMRSSYREHKLILAHFDDFVLFYKRTNNLFELQEVINYFENYYDLVKVILGKKIPFYNKINTKIFSAIKNYFSLTYYCFPFEKLPLELKKVFVNTEKILSSSQKINTLTMNPNINYEFFKYIYPNLGHDKSLMLLKYNSNATKELIQAYRFGNKELVDYFLSLIERYNIFSLNAENLHIIFSSFSKLESLLKELMSENYPLDNREMENLKRIIITDNHYNIRRISQLKDYHNYVKKELFDSCKKNYDDKSYVAKVFGLKSFFDLIKMDFAYQLNNFSLLKEIYADAKMILTDKEFEEIKFTKHEIEIMKLIKNIIKNNNENKQNAKYDMLFKKFFETHDICDMSLELKNIIRKIRVIYALHFNNNFTKIEDITQYRTGTINNVPIYHLSDNFNFLLHVIMGCDDKYSIYSDVITENPSSWDKLEGATTISTSAISEKNFNCVGSTKTQKIKLLFNEIPPNNFLYMHYQDSMIEHGGHKLEPKATNYSFSNILRLNQKAHSIDYTYSEISIYRQNMYPCAVAIFGDTPDEKSILVAQEFKVPIICINVEKSLNMSKKKEEMIFYKFKQQAKKELMKEILYSNELNIQPLDIVHILFEQFNRKTIDYKTCRDCLMELSQIMAKKEIHKSFIYNITRIRIILELINHKFPNENIRYQIIEDTDSSFEKLTYAGIKVYINEIEYKITHPYNKLEISTRKVAENLRKHTLPSQGFQVLSSFHRLIIQSPGNILDVKDISEKYYFDVAQDIALDYFLGVNIESIYAKKDANIVRLLGISSGIYLDAPVLQDNLNEIITKNNLYNSIINSSYNSSKICKQVELALKNMAEQIERLTLEDFIDIASASEEEFREDFLVLLVERQKFVPNGLRSISFNLKENTCRRRKSKR